jgi:hypothetical protein
MDAVQTGMDKILAKLASNSQSAGKKTPLPRGIAGKVDDKQPLQNIDQTRESRSVSSPPQSSNQDQSMFARATTNQVTMVSAQAPTMHDNVNERSGIDATEMLRLQRELIAANSRIAQQEQELAESRVIKHTLDQALGPPSEAEFVDRDTAHHNIRDLQTAFNSSATGFKQEHDIWMQDDAHSDVSEPFSAGAYNANRNLWGLASQAAFGIQGTEKAYHGASHGVQDPSSHPWTHSANNTSMTASAVPQQQRIFSGPSPALDGRFAGEHFYMGGVSPGLRRSVSQMNRAPAYFQPVPSTWAAFNNAVTNNVAAKAPLSPTFNAYQQVGLIPIPQYQPRPIGTPLSPTAAEFTSNTSGPNPWPATSVSIYKSNDFAILFPY